MYELRNDSDTRGHEAQIIAVVRVCDSLGRCNQESLSFAARFDDVPSPLTISREFDAVSNIVQLAYPSGKL